MSVTAEVAEAAGIKWKPLRDYDKFNEKIFGVKKHDREAFFAGLLLGAGLDLVWANSPQLQTLDTGVLEHYHASLALYLLTDDPVLHGVGATLLLPDIITPNPFGVFDPEPQRTANLAIGFTEMGLLALKYAWRSKRKRK